jgi:DNA-binding beta-propeller fold protein YncE
MMRVAKVSRVPSKINTTGLRRNSRCLTIGLALTAFALLTNCGGGGSTTEGGGPPPPPANPDFSLVLETPSVTVQRQGAPQDQVLQANPLNGFTGTVMATLSGLPAGVTATPPGPYSLVVPGPDQGVTIQLSASTAAGIGAAVVTATATSGSLTHSKNFPLTVAATAPFIVHVSPTNLSLTPGSSSTVQVSLTATPATSPQVSVVLSDLPQNSGIQINPPQGFLTPANPVSFTVEAGALAQPLQNFPLLISASDNGANSSSVTVPLTVSVPFGSITTTRSTFARTDQSPTGIVYDPFRKLVFVCVEVLNEVLVLSSVDGHLVSTIPVQYPAGIDEAVDGSAVYVVNPIFGYISTIDPNLFQVVRQSSVPSSVSGTIPSPPFFQIATLSNGKVFLLRADQSLTKSPFILWDPSTNTFTDIGTLPLPPYQGQITRSADHSKVLAWGGNSSGLTAVLYDATTDMLTGQAFFGSAAWLAINSNGSQIVAEGLQEQSTNFYDAHFNLLGSVSLNVFPATGIVYSFDGSAAYALGSFLGGNSGASGAVAVINAKTFSMVGLVPSFSFGASLPFTGSVAATFAVDETNMLFGSAFQGVGFLDMSSPGLLDLPLPGLFLVQPNLASLSAPTRAELNGPGFSSASSYGVFFGPPPASAQTQSATNISVQANNKLNLTVPTGKLPGPANVTLTRSDGFFEVVPDGVTFGPTVLRVDPDSGSPLGGDSIQIVGYGLATPGTQVTFGGKSATNVQLNVQPTGSVSGGIFPLDAITVTTPAGNPGPVDVAVSSPAGTVTIPGGFQYLTSAQVFSITGAFPDIVYDQSRQRLYLSNFDHNRVETFDLASQTFLAPLPVGNSPTNLALTPDGALLAVVNIADATISVIDPVKTKVVATYPLLTPADSSCGGQVISLSPVTPHRMLIDVNCTGALDSGLLHLINLDTGSLTCTGVAGCGTNGTDFNFGNAVMASSQDGSKVILGSTRFDGGTARLLDLIANTLTTGFPGSFFDAAASGDGTSFGASFAILNPQANPICILAYERYTDSGSQSLHNVTGEKLNASGSLFFVPQDSGVDIFDAHTGRLVRHVATPESIPVGLSALALDETGSKLFLISKSGITIMQLSQVPLGVISINPGAGPSGTQVTVRGSGFLSGATVTFGSSEVPATFVDSYTLQATVPSLSAGSVRITVTNPNTQQYMFDDAFTVN